MDHRGFGLVINTNLEEISDWLTKILVDWAWSNYARYQTLLVAGRNVERGLGSGMESTGSICESPVWCG